MRYRSRRYLPGNATPRDMTLKYAGDCACCGARIEAGQWATYYPPGTIGNNAKGAVAHIGGLDGNSQTCYANQCKAMRDRGEASTLYPDVGKAKDPGFVDLDRMYEDSCSDIVGR